MRLGHYRTCWEDGREYTGSGSCQSLWVGILRSLEHLDKMPPSIRGRILIVTSTFPRWSDDATTPFVYHLALDLRALGWQVDVLAPHFPGAARYEMLPQGIGVNRFRYWLPEQGETVCYDGGALIQIRQNRTNVLKIPFLVGAELAATLARLRNHYDLVNSHFVLPQGFVAGLASRVASVPHVVTIHGGDVFALQSPTMVAFKRWALRMSDAVTVNSSATYRITRELAPYAEIKKIPMGAGVPTPDRHRASELRSALVRDDGSLVCFVGRLVEEKGPGDLIAALPAIRVRYPGAKVVVVGDGPYRSSLLEQARTLGLEDHVHFAGWVDSERVAEYLAASDVFVGPSKQAANGWMEAFGLTFVEAALVGTPIVATRTGGVPDIVQDGVTGILVPESQPVAIAEAVVRLLDNPMLARSLANNAKHHALMNFTRRASANAFSLLLESVIAAKKQDNG